MRFFSFGGSERGVWVGKRTERIMSVTNWDCMGQAWVNPRARRGIAEHRAESLGIKVQCRDNSAGLKAKVILLAKGCFRPQTGNLASYE